MNNRNGNNMSIDPERWIQDRIWSMSGNSKELSNPSTLSKSIFMPSSTEEIASIIKRESPKPISLVCGGHEASNVALIANENAIILDLQRMKDISIEDNEVTVGAGVLFKELAEAITDAGNFALPIGTGGEVGVIGYIVNCGISGYFSRRLGLLSQRVLKMTVVNSQGQILTLTTKDGDKFTSMLGAGSALGVVTEVTIQLDDASILREAKQYVYVSDSIPKLVRFSRVAIDFLCDMVLPDESLSMEVVTTGKKAVVITIIFYDSFQGPTVSFCDSMYEEAKALGITLAEESTWDTWFQVAGALWPVIEGMRGNPLVMLQHCCGSNETPTTSDLDFIERAWINDAPLQEATMTIVEARTLGGEIKKRRTIPSGNCFHDFFVDMIVAYDAGEKSSADCRKIAEKTASIISKARQQTLLTVDFSGTHSQLDDEGTHLTVKANEIFGNEKLASQVFALKKEVDLDDRLRFHPYSKILHRSNNTN